MSLIKNIVSFDKFGLLFSRFSGRYEFLCDSSSLVFDNLRLTIQFGGEYTLAIRREGRSFSFDLSLAEINVNDLGRYEFGETHERYFAYKFGDTLVEFLKVDDAKGVPAILVLPKPSQAFGHHKATRCSGTGFTHSAYTHSDS